MKSIREILKANSDKVYLVKPNSAVQKYSELANFAENMAVNLPLGGITGIITEKPENMMPAILACWRRNSVPAIFEPQIKEEKYEAIKKVIGTRYLISDCSNINCLRSEKIIDINGISLNSELDFGELEIRDSSPALILFTSGSSGVPKCVPLSIKNIRSNIESFSKILGFNERDIFLSTSPLFYAHSLYNSFMTAFFLGGTVLYAGVLNLMNASASISMANRYKATVYHLTPSMMQIMLMMADRLKEPFPKFKHIICGTARLDAELKKKFETSFHCTVTQQYGMTETLFISVNADKQTELPQSVGIPVACEIRITNEEGNIVSTGEKGEISVKSESSFGSYFNQPEETKNSYFGEWFFTGDEGRFLSVPYLEITGRRKEMIKKGGININPHEINAVLLEYKGVTDASTVPVPDAVYGEQICSYVEGENINSDGIFNYCMENLPSSHIPKNIIILKKMPKTLTGKTDLQILKKMAKEKGLTTSPHIS